MSQFLEPGDLVQHPVRKDWGLGQVQSAVGDKITVNFEHAGKIVIDGSVILLLRAVASSSEKITTND